MIATLLLTEQVLKKMAGCLKETGIDCCKFCHKYNPEEQAIEYPDDVEPCTAKRYFGDMPVWKV